MDAAMAYETIDFKLADGIARLTLNRPERLNSFTVQMHEEVADALANLAGARTLILSGAGRGFCAGQDLSDRAVAPGEAVDLGESVEKRYNPLIRTLTSLPMPVIARVNGVAAGAGANIALLFALGLIVKSRRLSEHSIMREEFWRALPPRERPRGEPGRRMARSMLEVTWLRFAKGAAAVAIVLCGLAYASHGTNAAAWAQALRMPAHYAE